VTHHICVYFKPHTDDVKYNVPVWADRPRDVREGRCRGCGSPTGVAFRVGDGWKQWHRRMLCTRPSARRLPDHGARSCSRQGLTLFSGALHPQWERCDGTAAYRLHRREAAPQRVYVSFGMSSPSDAKSFAIPPNDGNGKPAGRSTFAEDVQLVYMFPHMHVCGKDYEYRLVYPTAGRRRFSTCRITIQLAISLRPGHADPDSKARGWK